jgi:TorA maturation chaperone TorD
MAVMGLDMEAQARASIYHFLAQVLSALPDAQSVRAFRELAGALGLAPGDDRAPRDLEREYMELFVVPNAKYVAPYESVYRDDWPLPVELYPGSNPAEGGAKIKGLLMGPSTERVRQHYAEAGVTPEQDLPDHIANELRFVAHLWQVEASAAAPGSVDAAGWRARFVSEHLLQWLGDLRDRVREGSDSGFYSAALEAAEMLLREEPGLVAPEPPGAARVEPEREAAPARCPWSGRSTAAPPGGAPVARCPFSAGGGR